ncbi:protein of unknown function [Pseudorhizobium banfieldiae]|uniref:Uncharacterized protein n=1 Tax=Pseudorhizobium banfieldiae TaxID=1125847 RepID=L0NB44_9HYPH|nr:protein of unknown function [Pseudorhizobium banfieldiae]
MWQAWKGPDVTSVNRVLNIVLIAGTPIWVHNGCALTPRKVNKENGASHNYVAMHNKIYYIRLMKLRSPSEDTKYKEYEDGIPQR